VSGIEAEAVVLAGTGQVAVWPITVIGAHSLNGIYGMCAFPASVRLDTGEPDHLGPFLGFLGDMLGELRG
jgi:hypothetical protein